VTLEQLANYADILGALTVFGGVVFGLIQLSEFRKQRRDAIAAELMRTFYSIDLADAVTLIRTLPDHCPATEVRERGPQYERAAVVITTSFETMGLLVFSRIADFELVGRLAGGMVVVMWRKLGKWNEAVRLEQSQPSWAEWFQWLAELAVARKDETRPAYLAHKAWKP
jgi:hypothetical protein